MLISAHVFHWFYKAHMGNWEQLVLKYNPYMSKVHKMLKMQHDV